MDQRYDNQVHMAALSMQQQHHHHHANHVHHQYQNHQYQHMYQDYSDACYHSTPYHEAAYSCDQYGYHPTTSVPYGTGIESYLDPKYAANPAAFASRLPYLPFHAAAAAAAYGMYDYSFEPAFIRKRNERERQRVKCVNEGYARLREHLPEEYAEKRLSKVETLRGAIMYIKQLQSLLGFDGDKSAPKSKTQPKKASQSEQTESETERCSRKRKLDEDLGNGESEAIVEHEALYPESENKSSTEMECDSGRKRVLSSCAFEAERSNNAERKLEDKNDVKLESESPMEESMKQREEFSDNFDPETVFGSCLMSDFPPCFKMGGRAEKVSPLENTQQPTADKELDTPRLSSFDFPQCSYDDVMSGITLDCHESGDHERGRTGSNQRDSCARRATAPFEDCNRRVGNIPEARIPPKYWPEHLLKQTKRGVFNRLDCARQNRYDSYINFANFKNVAKWDDVQVKSEIQTPPPCLHHDEFGEKADEQNFGLARGANYCAVSSRVSFNGACSRPMEHALPNGGQSDGFKSDTSPESSVGQSP